MFDEHEINTAQTSEASEGNVAADNGNADVINNTEATLTDEADFSETGTEEKDEASEQQKAQNSENARRRREAEQRRAQKAQEDAKKERQAAREAAIIETLDGINPYTGEEMKDSRDVEEYLTMKEIEKNGGDPLNDYSKHVKARERERETKANEEAQAPEWYAKDREAFVSKYPDVDVASLINDERFALYAEGKVGVRPLAEIYEGYRGLVGDQNREARNIAAQMIANKKASPGALSRADGGEKDFFSAEEVRKMSPADVSKNYDTIRASMKRW